MKRSGAGDYLIPDCALGRLGDRQPSKCGPAAGVMPSDLHSIGRRRGAGTNAGNIRGWVCPDPATWYFAGEEVVAWEVSAPGSLSKATSKSRR